MDASNSAVPRPVTRADIAAWVLAAIALALIIELHLLSSLLAGLLVFKLVDVLTPWLRLRALGHAIEYKLTVGAYLQVLHQVEMFLSQICLRCATRARTPQITGRGHS